MRFHNTFQAQDPKPRKDSGDDTSRHRDHIWNPHEDDLTPFISSDDDFGAKTNDFPANFDFQDGGHKQCTCRDCEDVSYGGLASPVVPLRLVFLVKVKSKITINQRMIRNKAKCIYNIDLLLKKKER